MRLKQLRSDYCLLEAFEALGERLFGDEWSGNEIWRERDHVTCPEELLAKRAPYVAELEEIDRETRRLRREKSSTVIYEETERLRHLLQENQTRQSELVTLLYENPEPNDCINNDWNEWLRKEKTMEVLKGGLISGEIRAICVAGTVIEKHMWAGEEPGFRCYLDQSIVVLPSRASSRKRATTRIPEAEFEKWLETILPINPEEAKKLSPKLRCEVWLKDQIRVGRQPKPKREFLKEAQALFEGLSERGFNAVWDKIVPDSWTNPGRRVWKD